MEKGKGAQYNPYKNPIDASIQYLDEPFVDAEVDKLIKEQEWLDIQIGRIEDYHYDRQKSLSENIQQIILLLPLGIRPIFEITSYNTVAAQDIIQNVLSQLLERQKNYKKLLLENPNNPDLNTIERKVQIVSATMRRLQDMLTNKEYLHGPTKTN